MNNFQKKYLLISIVIFLFSSGCALLIRAGGHLKLLPIFFYLFARYDIFSSFLSIIVLLVSYFFFISDEKVEFDGLFDWIHSNKAKLFTLITVGLALGTLIIYKNFPLTADEYMPCFQARIFAEGRLWGQYHPELVPWLLIPDYFTVFSAETGRVISDYWPGFALLLTPFMKMGVPWLLNPLVSGGTLVLLWYYTNKILPEPDAPVWALLLTVASPVFAANGISFYSMSAHLFLNLVYATLLLSLSPTRLFTAGLIGSFALVLHNPVPHMLFALPWIIWIGAQNRGFKNLAILFAGYLPLSLLLGCGWLYLKLLITKGSVVSEFGPQTGSLPISEGPAANTLNGIVALFSSKLTALIGSLFKAPDMELLWIRLIGLLKLFVWAIPGLPILMIMGSRYILDNKPLQLWGWSALFTFIGYLFVPFSQGHGWGFRYFHSAWLSLPLLATAFLVSTPTTGKLWKRMLIPTAGLNMIFCISLQFFQINQFIGEHLSQGPSFNNDKKLLCFFNTYEGYFLYDFVRNDPFLRNNVINFQSLGFLKDREMIDRCFPKAIQVSKTRMATIWDISDQHVFPCNNN